MEVEVELIPRVIKSKGATKALRRQGTIPCVVYSKGTVGPNCAVSKVAIDTVLRELETGFLPTTIFILKDASGKKRRAIIKDIQYKVTTYEVEHIDFMELIDDVKIDVKVPLQCLGVIECVGIKAGGYLRQVKLHIPVRCFPKDIPSHFEVNVQDVDIRQTRRLSDVKIPARVIPLMKPEDVVVTIVK